MHRLSVRGIVTLVMRTFVTCHPPRQDIFNAALLGKKLWCLYNLRSSAGPPVALLSVMKAAGDGFVLLDPAHQFQRLQQICQEVKDEVVLASIEYKTHRNHIDGNFQMAYPSPPQYTLCGIHLRFYWKARGSAHQTPIRLSQCHKLCSVLRVEP